MALTKQQLRLALRPLVGQNLPLIATSAGASDGSTFIDTHYNGAEQGYFTGNYILIDSGTHTGKYAPVSAVSETDPKTMTMTPALGSGAVAVGVTAELHSFPPFLYTTALNLALGRMYTYRAAYKVGNNSSLTVVAGQVAYTLPTGYTRENIVSIWQEGDGDFDEIPTTLIENVDYDPSGAVLWLGRRHRIKQDVLSVGRKIYLYAELPLTALDPDTTLGLIATDTTAKVELTADTDPYYLLLDFARAEFFLLLAAEPSYGKREEAMSIANAYMEQALKDLRRRSMPSLESAPLY